MLLCTQWQWTMWTKWVFVPFMQVARHDHPQSFISNLIIISLWLVVATLPSYTVHRSLQKKQLIPKIPLKMGTGDPHFHGVPKILWHHTRFQMVRMRKCAPLPLDFRAPIELARSRETSNGLPLINNFSKVLANSQIFVLYKSSHKFHIKLLSLDGLRSTCSAWVSWGL